jgi:hypothetical protein
MRSPGRGSSPLVTLIAIAAVAGAWMNYQHSKTGRWSLMPVKLTPTEQEIFRFEKRVAEIDSKLTEYDRMSGMSGEKAFYHKDRQNLVEEREELMTKIKRLQEQADKEKASGS